MGSVMLMVKIVVKIIMMKLSVIVVFLGLNVSVDIGRLMFLILESIIGDR